MSREIVFYAVKNKDLENKIELYWTGADSAQLLFDSIDELNYGTAEADYVEVDSAARQIQEALGAKIGQYAERIKEYEGYIEEYRLTMKNISELEIYDEIMSRILEYKRDIKEFQEDMDFYKILKRTMITICNLDFLQTKYDGTPSEWELYILYSY